MIIWIDIKFMKSVQNRRMYSNSEPFRFSENYITGFEDVIWDTACPGNRAHIVFPIKQNQCGSFQYRSRMNRDIKPTYKK